MKLIWKGDAQFTAWGQFTLGMVIDTEALGIPAAVAQAWIETGWAVEDKGRKIKPPRAEEE